MREKGHVLAGPGIGRSTVLRLPDWDFWHTTPPGDLLAADIAWEFCANYRKLQEGSFITEGIIRVDYHPEQPFRSWEYGVATQMHGASKLTPLCLVILQTLVEPTTCRLTKRDERNALVIGSPYVAIYAKAASRSADRQQGPLPVPMLPLAAEEGYTAVYSSEVREVTIFMDGTAQIAEFER